MSSSALEVAIILARSPLLHMLVHAITPPVADGHGGRIPQKRLEVSSTERTDTETESLERQTCPVSDQHPMAHPSPSDPAPPNSRRVKRAPRRDESWRGPPELESSFATEWPRATLAKLTIVWFAYLTVAFTTRDRTLPVFCPFRILTGVQCPLCGFTTATGHLLRGEVRSANRAHPLAIIAVPGTGIWLLQRWRDEHGLRPNRRRHRQALAR